MVFGNFRTSGKVAKMAKIEIESVFISFHVTVLKLF